MLIPRRVKFRKQHHPKRHGLAKGGTEVSFGEWGIQALSPAYVTNRQIEAARIAMTRHIKRGGKAKLDKIDVVPNDFGTPLEVFEQVAQHERRVSKMIDELVDVASAEKDKATQDFLWGFVREQVEEEATAQGIVDKIKKAGDTGIFFVDSQLGQR